MGIFLWAFQKHSTTTGAFVFLAKFTEFHYQKILNQEVDDDLSICMNEGSPCDLYVTVKMKIYQFHVIKRQWRYQPQWRSALWTSMNESF